MAEDQDGGFAGDAGNFAGDEFVEDESPTTPMVWRGKAATMSSRRVISTLKSAAASGAAVWRLCWRLPVLDLMSAKQSPFLAPPNVLATAPHLRARQASRRTFLLGLDFRQRRESRRTPDCRREKYHTVFASAITARAAAFISSFAISAEMPRRGIWLSPGLRSRILLRGQCASKSRSRILAFWRNRWRASCTSPFQCRSDPRRQRLPLRAGFLLRQPR